VGNSPDKLRHTRSFAYSVELVVLNKHQISGGGAYLDGYPLVFDGYEYACKTSVVIATFPRLAGDELTVFQLYSPSEMVIR